MNSKVYSATIIGIEAQLVTVEVAVEEGKKSFSIVGLADSVIQESKKRVYHAITNSVYKHTGIENNLNNITVNLAPANIRKIGNLFDLPIAIGILDAQGLHLNYKTIKDSIFVGELSFDGKISPVQGILSIAEFTKKLHKKYLVIPKSNAQEAALIKGIEVIGVESLDETIHWIEDPSRIASTTISYEDYVNKVIANYDMDFSDVKGQSHAKRVLQISAAGKHNILFQGPPGTGKTMLAKRLITIMPPMNFEEICQTTKIYSTSGNLANKGLITERTFRSPHHTISSSGLLGGGKYPQPGEISLAHNGILFLDEFIEFKRNVIEGLRQSIEEKVSHINRDQIKVTYPADFILIVAFNPCPCGYFGDKKVVCKCTKAEIVKYKNKLSGPILDRIDIKITINPISYEEAQERLVKDPLSSEVLRESVTKAVKRQEIRFQKHMFNSQMTGDDIDKYCKLTPQAEEILKMAFDKLNMSMRTYHKILKIARTVADLEDLDLIDVKQIQEAIVYKS